VGLRTLFRRKRPLTCQEVVELVTAYLEGALDGATSARFEAHLADCDGCAAYLDQFRSTIATMGTISDNQLDPVFRARLMKTFEETAGSW
jgi:anti-sigma factor RsiW